MRFVELIRHLQPATLVNDRIGVPGDHETPEQFIPKVFELTHYHGLQLRTVAGILKTTEGTIKNTLFRATHKLRLQLSAVR
jgi:RNA polymerase sigma-70 factor (ECF subfamily)